MAGGRGGALTTQHRGTQYARRGWEKGVEDGRSISSFRQRCGEVRWVWSGVGMHEVSRCGMRVCDV